MWFRLSRPPSGGQTIVRLLDVVPILLFSFPFKYLVCASKNKRNGDNRSKVQSTPLTKCTGRLRQGVHCSGACEKRHEEKDRRIDDGVFRRFRLQTEKALPSSKGGLAKHFYWTGSMSSFANRSKKKSKKRARTFVNVV